MIQYFSYDYNDHISKLDLIIAELTKLGHRLSNGVWKDPLSNTYIGYIESDKATDILTRFNLTILNSEQVIILVEKYFENNQFEVNFNKIIMNFLKFIMIKMLI